MDEKEEFKEKLLPALSKIMQRLPREAMAPETDIHKVKVDTVRRRRRKGLISRDEEIALLLELRVSPDDAEAFADNDDIRLAKSQE